MKRAPDRRLLVNPPGTLNHSAIIIDLAWLIIAVALGLAATGAVVMAIYWLLTAAVR